MRKKLNNLLPIGKVPVDLVQEAMGSLGPWHVVIAIALSLVKFPVAWHQLSIVFLAPPVNFTCVSPLPANQTTSLLNKCEVDVIGNNVTFEDCVQFHYDRSEFRETIITQVCCGWIFFPFLRNTNLRCSNRKENSM